jgi:thiamine biosynthesis lipoprotein
MIVQLLFNFFFQICRIFYVHYQLLRDTAGEIFEEAFVMRYKTTEKIFPALGTLNSVIVYGTADLADFSGALDSVRTMVLRLDDMLSLYKESSELSAVNRSAGVGFCDVSEDTYRIFKAAVVCSGMTDGAFDITAGRISQLWKQNLRRNCLPGFIAREAVRRRTDYRNIVISEDAADNSFCVSLKKKGMSADLGGIAKGYAADRAREILLAAGITNATINFGGTVFAIGSEQEVGIQNPFFSRKSGINTVGKLSVRNQAVVTSGSYEQCCVINGRKYHHIIDPRTGYPAASGLSSVTLVGTNAMELDALATGCFVLGIEKSLPVLKSRNIGGIFIREDGGVLFTEDLRPDFTLCATPEAG